jgi:Flp pilus assembly protein CpaB
MMTSHSLAHVNGRPDDLEFTSPLDDQLGRFQGHGLAFRRQAGRWMGDGQPVAAPTDALGRRLRVTGTALSSRVHVLRRPRRIDLRAVMGLLLLLVAVVGSLSFWSASSNTRPVLVAARDLPAGATLNASDLAIARVRVDDAIYQAAVPAEQMASVVGKALADPLHAQQLLVRAQISNQPPLGPDQMALTIGISPESAVGGQLRPGDAVQVLLTTNKGTPAVHTMVVLPRATIYDVGYDQETVAVNTGGSDQRSISWLTLIVTPEEAVQLGQAKWAGELDVALLPPASE